MGSLFAEQLKTRVLCLDGAMGTSIHNYDLDIETDYCGCENCTDVLVKSRPDVIGEIHRSFLEVGCDAVETDSFGGPRHVLAEFDLDGDTYELNKRAAEVARAEADAFSTKDKPRFVMGSMGPGTRLITLGQISWAEMLESYREQARGLIDGGADTLLLETCQDLLQVKCALNACLAALDDRGKTPQDIPLMVNVTVEQQGTMLVGSSIEAALVALREYPILSLGLNCATGPVEMADKIAYLSKSWRGHVAVLPNAGLPILEAGKTVYPLQPEPFAEALSKFIDQHGVSIVGGCCGTTPEHLERVVRVAEAGQKTRAQRTLSVPPASSGSLYTPVPHRQDNSFLIVGERCNASGSRAFKRLLEAEDWEAIISLARSQVREGSHVLDINVDYAGRDNASDMSEIVGRLSRQVDVPLMLDSTQPKTIEAGLERAAGRCIINSANFEDGEEKFDELCRLAVRYNAALVIGTIDEDPEEAMARTADRKLSIAQRAIERATEKHGLVVEDLFIDPLVLPISTGMDSDRRSALALVEGTRRIAERFPGVQITCGLSNVSFGLNPAARQVLNSVFLHELTQAGLTSAIVHSSKILPLNRIDDEHQQAALDLIYDRRSKDAGGTGLPEGQTDEGFDPLSHLIDLFRDATAAGAAATSTKDLTLEERLRKHIIDGERDGLVEALEEALETYAPLDIINDHLLDGMKTVGELFGSGQMQLPFVLQSAEVMKRAVAHLEPKMDRVEGQTRGSIVLATVKGDVHDIGKNLVDIILSNNGFTVYNIGIKQPIDAIVAKWRETKADAIGLSGLLVKSVNVMEDNLRELNGLDIDVPVILGGAALARDYAEGHLRDVYDGHVLYGKDAFEGLRLMDWVCTGRMDELQEEIKARVAKVDDSKRRRAEAVERKREADTVDAAAAVGIGGGDGAQGAAATATLPARSAVARDLAPPTPPFWGSRVVPGESLNLDTILAFINPKALYQNQWQFRRGSKSKAEWQALVDDEIKPVYERLVAECKAEGILKPAVVYGYAPVSSEGDDLVIFDAEDHDREVGRFSFPRQASGKRLCISDFFKDADECRELGRKDVLGMSCVTMGQTVSERTKALFDAGEFKDYLYLHGLGVEAAEALAELWHKRMRQELSIDGADSPKIAELFTQKYRGSRYSFGYPACPEMQDQELIWKLIDPTRIGCELTENWQIDPEQSTSAIVVHHPEAKYFNT